MPRIRFTRGDRIALPSGAIHSIAKPVNDVLGLRDDDRYVDWLQQEWGGFAPSRAAVQRMLGPSQRDDSEAGLTNDLAAIAAAASQPGGTLDFGRLAALLSQVGRYPPDGLEVPSLAGLAAWALGQEVDRRVDVLVTCPTCKRPWFARPLANTLTAAFEVGDRPCSRPAPGLTLTCAQLAASDRFARERSEWSREYRRVMARKLRGTVSDAEFRAWKAISKPGKRGEDWVPFDEWKGEQHG